MSARSLFAVLSAVMLAGCGKPPEGSPGPTLAIGEPTNRSEQKRALAGKEKATVGPITAEVLGWGVKKRKDVEGVEPKPGQDECMVVRVRFATTDDTVKRSTAHIPFSGCECRDEFGNAYQFDTWALHIKGDEMFKDVTRESPVTRVILIEKPISKAGRFDLDLSATPTGDGDKFRFTIPLK